MSQEKIYEQVNARIIALLEQGVAPWRKPWKNAETPIARNLISKKPYRGINFIMTNFGDYNSPDWATYNQIKQKGGNVKRGEKGTIIVFWKMFSVKDEKATNEDKTKLIPFLRHSYVFNVEQCENIKIEPVNPVELIQHDPIVRCESLLKRFPLGMPELRHNKDRAYYSPVLDFINMPNMDLFAKPEEYYHTLFHESIHATGYKLRLNRPSLVDVHYFGDPNYSQEELVAEMGASYISALCGIDNATIDNSASYLSSWLAAIRKDNKLILKAASQSQKAVDYLTGYRYEEASDESDV